MAKQTKHLGEVYYTCPMHPEVHKAEQGICPKCGMKLVPVKGIPAYGKHEGHSTSNFILKFWISFALTVPVVLYSGILQELFSWSLPSFPGSSYIPIVLSSVIFFYGGWVFIIGAFRELRAKMPGMMTLIAIAISAAYLFSVVSVFFSGMQNLFWELTTLITVMLLGHWIEMKAVQGSQAALKELAELLPDKAEVVLGKKIVLVSLSELKVGDFVLVKPGSKIPADGVVVEGDSDVNESIITGESKLVGKTIGSEVIAGSINGDGRLIVKVTNTGEGTFLAAIMRLVSEAQASKSRLQVLSDKAAFFLTIIAVTAGSATFITWVVLGKGVPFAIERFVVVLVIACPHALGLAIPLVASISTTMAAKNGFLVKQRIALESARNVDVVLFDKTGTLTKGEFGVADIIQNKESKYGSVKNVLQLAASADSPSEHFVAKAIVAEAKKKKVGLLPVKDFMRVPGKGVKCRVGRFDVLVGGSSILGSIKVPSDVKKLVAVHENSGMTVIYVIAGRSLVGAIALSDVIREESREAIKDLKAMGVKVAMVTGDSEEVAKMVSSELGISEYFAHVKPDMKASKVKELQSRKLRVAMVGDGVNDAPALMQADIGIAVGAGTNVALESAGIVLVRNDPRDIVRVIRLSRHTYNKMLQNLFWATGYNVVAMPLAAGVLASKGLIMQPAVGAVFMSLSTVIVALNALLLKRAKI